MELVAHYTGELPEMKIAPAPRDRPWMPRNAGRCLPLRIANEAGWWVLNPLTFGAVWNGKYTQDAVRLFDSGGVRAKIPHATSLFGNGILTFYLPYLFRTEPGWNLLARGPANHPKHGIQALEGLVETDWSIAPFTMNWKLTAPNVPVTFSVGEPICQIVPFRRGDLERCEPRVEKLSGALAERFSRWARERQELKELKKQQRKAGSKVDRAQRRRQGHYARGQFTDETERFAEHQTRLRLKPFAHRGRPGNEGGG